MQQMRFDGAFFLLGMHPDTGGIDEDVSITKNGFHGSDHHWNRGATFAPLAVDISR